MFTLRETGLAGCYEILPRRISDARGIFIKTFHAPAFRELGLEAGFVEEYYTTSRHGVLRGLHFQIPPADHAKLVYCIAGSVLDAVVDLRTDSGSYGKHVTLELSDSRHNILFIPRGFAHGFFALSDCTMVYKVTSVHSPEHDRGIRWDSAGIAWPGIEPIVSDRDRTFARLAEFESPFRMGSPG